MSSMIGAIHQFHSSLLFEVLINRLETVCVLDVDVPGYFPRLFSASSVLLWWILVAGIGNAPLEVEDQGRILDPSCGDACFILVLPCLAHAICNNSDDRHTSTGHHTDAEITLAQTDIDLLTKAVGADQGSNDEH